MIVYTIFETDKTAQQLPLNKLYQLILSRLKEKNINLTLLSSEGYGITICQWEDLLRVNSKIIISHDMFNSISKGTNEWFYNVDIEIKLENNIIWFGLMDSSYLYIASQKDIFSDILTDSFKKVVEVSSLPWEKSIQRRKDI